MLLAGLTAGAGNQFVTLGGGFFNSGTARWSTTITGLTIGQTYNLTFEIANENNFTTSPQPEGPPSPQTLSVSINSVAMGDFTAPVDMNSIYWKSWIPESVSFVATSTSESLAFSSTTNFDIGLDNVQITQTPIPAALPLFATGIGGLGLLGWRRKRKARTVA